MLGCFTLPPGSSSLDIDSEGEAVENQEPLEGPVCDAVTAAADPPQRGRRKTMEGAAATASDKTTERWCALAPEKSAKGAELSVAVLGASSGGRLRHRSGLMLLLKGDIPSMTTHEGVGLASAALKRGDPVAAAKALDHAAPLTAAAMVQAHLHQVHRSAEAVRGGISGDYEGLTPRDRLRVQLQRSSPLPAPFSIVWAPAEYKDLQDSQFEDGSHFAAHSRCKELRLTATVGDCQVLSGGWMSAAQAAADDTSRAPDCVVEFSMRPPFQVRFEAFPPVESKETRSRLYSKVHAICPDGKHRAILLGLPRTALDQQAVEETTRVGQTEQKSQLAEGLPYKCSLLRRCIERGRLFGGGQCAVEAALSSVLDSKEATATAAGLRSFLVAMLEAVRLWLPRSEHVSFGTLAMLAVLSACLPTWRPPPELRSALLRTVSAAQAADQEHSQMRWSSWRQAKGGGDDGQIELPDVGRDLPEVRNALRLLTRGFLCLSSVEADMVARYTDVMVRRGGLPLFRLPLPGAEDTPVSDSFRVAAVDSRVVPNLALHFQAALTQPPLCQSTCLKDCHMRNLRFFIEETLFNIRQQKYLKVRGGYIEAMDMERIVNYMDEEHFAAGRDLAEARALKDDSELHHPNLENIQHEEECHLQSERCQRLRATLEALQKSLLHPEQHGSLATETSSASTAKCTVVCDSSGGEASDETAMQRARLEGFLSLYGATLEVRL